MDDAVIPRVGYEIECVVPRSKYLAFRASIRRVKSTRAGRGLRIGEDASIFHYESRERDVELATRAINLFDSLRLLKTLLAAVRKYGRTNKSCGLHVNIDFPGMSMETLEQRQEVQAVREQWKRQVNIYCENPFPITFPATNVPEPEISLCPSFTSFLRRCMPKKEEPAVNSRAEAIKDAMTGHYKAVSYRDGKYGQYFEFRPIGGIHYDHRYPEIRRNVLQFCYWMGWEPAKPLLEK